MEAAAEVVDEVFSPEDGEVVVVDVVRVVGAAVLSVLLAVLPATKVLPDVGPVDEAVVSVEVEDKVEVVPETGLVVADEATPLAPVEAVDAAELTSLATDEAMELNAEEPVESGKGMTIAMELLDIVLEETPEEVVAVSTVVVVVGVAGPTGVGARSEDTDSDADAVEDVTLEGEGEGVV